ncbi:MAG: hypothetical protein IJZ22_08960 [Bacteroidaceae bacterium]|nr:hypothetical protein [Bacteroidaceae bacterium]
MKKKITFSKSGARSTKRTEEDIISKALGNLFATTAAVYDRASVYYSLNGLKVTEGEMVAIYGNKEVIDKLDLWQVMRGSCARTIMPCEKEVGVRLKNRPLKGYYSFADSLLEVLKFSEGQTLDCTDEKELLPVESLDGTFCNCKELRIIYPMNIAAVDSIGEDTFKECTALQELRLHGLKTSLDIAAASQISYNSLLYMVANNGNSGSIGITVSPATYKYLTALELPSGSVGGTSEEWQNLHNVAQTKGIMFNTSGIIAYVQNGTLHLNNGVVDETTLVINDASCNISDGIICFQ